MRKDVREFIRRLEAVGLTVESTPGHYRVLRDGEPLRKANGDAVHAAVLSRHDPLAQSGDRRTAQARHRPVAPGARNAEAATRSHAVKPHVQSSMPTSSTPSRSATPCRDSPSSSRTYTALELPHPRGDDGNLVEQQITDGQAARIETAMRAAFEEGEVDAVEI
jgi:hypothetical protein